MLGRKVTSVVTARFPPPMELKSEAVCCPFLMLHVKRCVAPVADLLHGACIPVSCHILYRKHMSLTPGC